MSRPPLYFENVQQTWYVVMQPDSGIRQDDGSVNPVLSYPLLIYPNRQQAEATARPDCFVIEVKPVPSPVNHKDRNLIKAVAEVCLKPGGNLEGNFG